MNKKAQYINLGKVSYQEGHDVQEKHFKEIIDVKLTNRDAEKATETPNYLFFCEHPHVYTLGRSGDKKNLLINLNELQQKEAEYHETGRGGDITYHGPGQLVGYPIFDLDNFFTDIHKYLRYLEEAVILTLKDYDLDGGRIEGLTGVWLDYEKKINPRKICAFGVKASRWVTMHGFALNVNTDLSYFNNIVPCGISDKAVTSISAELQREIDFSEVEERMLQHLTDLFELEIERK